jgi:hypothetical protein
MKKYLTIALLGIATLANANTCNLFSSVNCYNTTYNCGLPVTTPSADQQISSCTFTFTSLNSYSAGLLYCNLTGGSSTCNVGSQGSSTPSWTCTLNSAGLDYLNNCVSSGKSCNFGIDCRGGWQVGSCKVDYTCSPTPHTAVPEVASTAALMGLGLLAVGLFRRQLVPALVKK